MPAEESKPVDQAVNEVDAEIKAKQAAAESEGEEDDEEVAAGDASAAGGASASASKKKKKSKKKKLKEALTGKPDDAEADLKKAIGGLTPQQLQELLALNPALAGELAQASGSANPSPDQISDLLKKMNLQDIMTGLAAAGKNVKDMASYKFWQTQPVPRFGDDDKVVEEGPLRIQTVDDVSKEPAALVDGFEWVTMDLDNDEEIKEIYELLNGHYVEDDEAMFRFNYGPGILKWAMMPPGWAKHYHVGVRATQSRKLVAFISAIPVRVRLRNKTITASEVNFLCVHKKLRGKRLAPRPHQGDHPHQQPARDLAGPVHRRHRPPQARQHMPLLPPLARLAEAVRVQLCAPAAWKQAPIPDPQVCGPGSHQHKGPA
ncbi:uncharacterized protein TrAtP1_006667 [Trichoderma atroviride]|uniref:uncharacterized protein n=1 Tax=Hypocrea atroviridis TaxID=63577 RepID=UPI00332AE4F6|nr:hypothetical protein TrAtP1_006667 [Trichoderma atroviride]